MSKTDHQLGLQVRDHLIAAGVETPMIPLSHARPLYTPVGQKEKIAEHFAAIMQILGLDLNDDSLVETPKRVAKMYVDEIFYGLDYSKFPKCTTVENKMRYSDMVMERNVSVQSNCEHHFVVIAGKAQVAYIPKDKVLGLSKINRVVEFFSKRPQIQERLSAQIYHALQYILGTDDVAVVIEAEHYCVKSRGVRDEGSSTVSSHMGGKFMDPALRAEFMSFVERA